MIFYGHYRIHEGAFRPFITGYLKQVSGKWVKFSFLIDSGADETFLHYRSIDLLNINTNNIDVRDDVGGIGGYGIPYFKYKADLKLVSAAGNAVFSGDVNIFLDPHAVKFPILGRDVLDQFTVIFDRSQGRILLLNSPDTYQLFNQEDK
jgi:hypothetical protein